MGRTNRLPDLSPDEQHAVIARRVAALAWQGSGCRTDRELRSAMTQHVGLDVSLKITAVCVVDETGDLTAESKVASEPEALGGWLREHAPAARRIGMETGPY